MRYGLQIGGYMSKPVLALMWLMAPLAWPTAKLLDWLLGEDHGTVYKKSGLKTLVTLHKNLGDVSERLNQDEVTIISAVLDLKAKPVESVMTPMSDVFTMSEDTCLDEETMDLILSAGYSRIPIHEPGNPTNFVGMLLVKILITYDPEDAKLVRDFPLATLPETRPETSCLDIVNFFQEGKSHMVLVSEYPGEDHGALGVVTLEDVIEELIGEEIIDESDVYIDVHKAIRRLTPAPKARLQRRPSENNQVPKTNNDTATGILVDVSDPSAAEATPPVAAARRPGSVTANTTSDATHLLSSSPRAATVMMRRSSAGLDGHLVKSTVPVRANLEEMRQHLRHLGPSNPATNPKNTRSTTVKIKPGIAATTPSSNNTLRTGSAAGVGVGGGGGGVETIDEAGPAPHRQDDETTALLNAVSGKDGIQALQEHHYGTTVVSPQQPKTPTTPPTPKANGSTQTTAEEDKSTQTTRGPDGGLYLGSLSAVGSSSKNSSVHSLPSDLGSQAHHPPPPPSHHHHQQPKRFVRSGSITENVVETRAGVRKVVLETTSSSNEDDEIVARSPGGGSPRLRAASRSALALFSGGGGRGDIAEEDDEDDDEDEEEGGGGKTGGGGDGTAEREGASAAASNSGASGAGSGAGGTKAPARKKNNRRKKRRGGKS